MKKLLPILVIGILLIGMPMATAISSPLKQLSQSTKKTLGNDISTFVNTKTASTKDSPPNWANGNFSGVWGLDIWGEYHIPLGWMFGYYKWSVNFGYFYAGFAFFGEPNVSWYIQGYFFGPFMFGSIGENEYSNETLFVGIGRYNETDYHWRVMGEIGPTFFMHGTYTKFD